MSKHNKKSGKAEAEKEQPSGNYEVGRARPPVHSQFKPGQSGNPKGRPKGRKNAITMMDEAAEALITVRENGHERKTPKAAAVFEMLMNKALQGDARATKLILDHVYRKEGRSEPPAAEKPLTSLEEGMLDDLFIQLAESRGIDLARLLQPIADNANNRRVRQVVFPRLDPIEKEDLERRRKAQGSKS